MWLIRLSNAIPYPSYQCNLPRDQPFEVIFEINRRESCVQGIHPLERVNGAEVHLWLEIFRNAIAIFLEVNSRFGWLLSFILGF